MSDPPLERTDYLSVYRVPELEPVGRFFRATFTTVALLTASFAPLGLTRSQREALARALARSVRVEWQVAEAPYEATTTRFIFIGRDGTPLIATPVCS